MREGRGGETEKSWYIYSVLLIFVYIIPFGTGIEHSFIHSIA